MRQEYYENGTVRISTYEQVLNTLLETYATNEVLVNTNKTLHDMRMARNNTLTTFAVRLMKWSLGFAGIYSKAQLLLIFFGGLQENLHCAVCQKLSEASYIIYDKLASDQKSLHKMTTSKAPMTKSSTPPTSRKSM